MIGFNSAPLYRRAALVLAACTAAVVAGCSTGGTSATNSGSGQPASTSSAASGGSSTISAAASNVAASGNSASSNAGSSAAPSGFPASCLSDPTVAKAASLLSVAEQTTIPWSGPTTGPKAEKGKTVAYVAQDMTNGGVLGVSKGVQAAAKAIGWKLTIIDGQGTVAGRVAAIEQAISLHVDGIILGSVDSQEEKSAIEQANKAGIKVVGWHSTATPGPVTNPTEFTNITSSAADTAMVAAAYALQQTDCKAGAVVFWQSGDQIGISKAEKMRSIIQSCSTCKMLDYVNTPIADTSTRMQPETTSLIQRFGTKWNVALGINDSYCTYGAPALPALGIAKSGPPVCIAAGDGSIAAFSAIRGGNYQVATVAEPLYEAGWQAIDELNRALAGDPPSGFVTKVHIVTKENIGTNGGPQNIYDPSDNYEQHYKQIWGVS